MEIKEIIKLKEAGFEPDEITKIKDRENIKDFITLKNQGFTVDQMLELIPEKEVEPPATEREEIEETEKPPAGVDALKKEIENLREQLQAQNRKEVRQEKEESKEMTPEEALARFYAPHLYNNEDSEKEK